MTWARLACVPFAAAGLVAHAAPATVEVRGAVPGDGLAKVRLAFRQGVQVEAARLPRRFLPVKTGPWAAYSELTPAGRLWALHTLFPEDRWGDAEVRHKVRWPELESVWLMSALFVGHGQHYDKLQAANPGHPEKLAKGDLWVIPRTLLAKELGGIAKPSGAGGGDIGGAKRTVAQITQLGNRPDARLAQLEGRPGFTFQKLDLADRNAVPELFQRIRPQRVVQEREWVVLGESRQP